MSVFFGGRFAVFFFGVVFCDLVLLLFVWGGFLGGLVGFLFSSHISSVAGNSPWRATNSVSA